MHSLKKRRLIIGLCYGILSLNYFAVWCCSIFFFTLQFYYLLLIAIGLSVMVPVAFLDPRADRYDTKNVVITIVLYFLLNAALALFVKWCILALVVIETTIVGLLIYWKNKKDSK